MTDPRQTLGPVLTAAVEALIAEALAGTCGQTSPFVTPAEAATILACPRQHVYDLASSGRLARFKENGRTLHRRADVLALVKPERRK